MKTVKIGKLDIEPGDWILDLGCGEGRHLRSLSHETFARTVGYDLDYEVLSTCQEKADSSDLKFDRSAHHLSQGDARKLPFDDQQFDVIICSEVLEHIVEYESVLEEIVRVLSTDGQLALSVPQYLPEKICWLLSDEYHQVDGGHVRIFRHNELKGEVESHGFKCFDTHSAHALHSPYWWLQCLFWNNRDTNPLINTYERFLEWDLFNQPRVTKWLEQVLNPIIGKSTVLYFRKESS